MLGMRLELIQDFNSMWRPSKKGTLQQSMWGSKESKSFTTINLVFYTILNDLILIKMDTQTSWLYSFKNQSICKVKHK
jgi:hypothetical protein